MTGRPAAAWTRDLTLVVLAATFAAPALHGQPRATEIRDRSDACRGCSITLTRVTTLVPPDTAPVLGGHSGVARDSRGRFYVTSGDDQHLLRFSNSGRFEGELGRPGQGPGEFQRLLSVRVGPADSVFAFDRGGIAVFTPTGSLARTAPMPARFYGAIMQADGSMIGQLSSAGAGSVALPVHVLTPKGSVTRSFGMTRAPRYVPSCPQCSERSLNQGRDSRHVWLAARNRYEFESWSTDGQLLRGYRVIDSKWFEDWDQPTEWYDGSARVTTSVLQIAEDSGGLWVLGRRASAKPRRLPPPEGSGLVVTGRGVMGRNRGALDDYLFDMMNQNTEMVLEYIDLRAGHIVASTQLQAQLRLLDAQTVARIVRDADGLYGIEIHTLRLTRPRAP